MTNKNTQRKPLPSGVRLSGYGKQFLAYIIDFSLTLATLFLIYIFLGSKVIVPAMGYETVLQNEERFIEASGIAGSKDDGYPLFTYDEAFDGTTPVYEKYEEIVWNYYTVFVATNPDAEFLSTDKYEEGTPVSTWVLSHIYHIEEGKDIDLEKQPYYTVYEVGGVKDYTHRPVLNAAYNKAMNETNEEGAELTREQAAANLKLYYSTVTKSSSSNASGLYIDVVYHFQDQSYYLDCVGQITTIRYMAFLPGVVIAPLIFYFLVPMITKNGRTCGKIICKLAILSQEGYEAKKWQILVRSLILTAFWFLLLLPSTFLGIALALGCIMVDYMFLSMTKTHQSLHDKAGKTIVIDAKNSKWYKDAEDEAAHAPKAEEQDPAAVLRAEVGETLDMASIQKAREEAAAITSFDEFEKQSEKKE